MGQIVKITCTSCKAEWKCQIGCGILHGDLSRVAELYPAKQCQKIRSYAEQAKYPIFDFGYSISRCMYCNCVEGVPVLRLKENDETYVGDCQGCMQAVELIADIEEAECPVCRQKSLKEEPVGMWD